MNIFYLSKDPKQCAEWMVDKHTIKMILESAQLLSTAHRLLDGKMTEIFTERAGKSYKKKVWVLPDRRESILYSATHINHPSAIWARQSVENYNWLVDHMFALGDEYTYRYGKKHKTIENLGYTIQSPPFNLKEWDETLMPSCMADQYIVSEDPIVNYQNYYKKGKAHLHRYTKRNPPDWLFA
jgi:hypothetical protein